ncbi:hypothetical protein MsAg5_01620 [Methanosarcinaceae archaeon Ag5]|uniref:Archaeosortase A n=1 Tax=Methanolapillus africanus TaxID=3028297 RepID=A0AAE4SCB2_9EURY|nr:hypothetical protein [Methanosarcinaceae archaeon Ag5]
MELFWISIALMIVSLLLYKEKKIFEVFCGATWVLFGVYWLSLIPHYYEISDYTNIVLVVLLFFFCLLLAVFIGHAFKDKNREKHPGDPKSVEIEKRVQLFFDVTKLVAIVCLIYMPFKMIEPVNTFLIDMVASNTTFLLNLFGYDAIQTAYNTISYNGISVTIILACTAIESIAFFAGLTISVRTKNTKNKVLAFLLTVPVIYILNLFRNVFVVAAYGDMWFGANSFIIAHHYLAKAGSAVVLIVLAFVTLKLLPEVMDMTLELWDLVTDEVRRILKIEKKEKAE